jgi:hypothetical protein
LRAVYIAGITPQPERDDDQQLDERNGATDETAACTS